MMRKVHFLIPDPEAFPSGGNVFNARLIQALKTRGVPVTHEDFKPIASAEDENTLYILDSIYFSEQQSSVLPIPHPCIGLIHHLSSLFPFSEDVYQRDERLLLEQFDGFIVSSWFASQYLVEHGFDASRICIIEPAPTLHRNEQFQEASKVRALMIGSCTPRKGQLAFLEALWASDISPYYSLTIAGSLTADPQYASQCADIILQHDHLRKCVRLLGEQDAATIQKLYKKHNLFISASAMETFGMAIQDAVVCGLPVLAIEGGYAAEHVISNVNGYRCQTMEQIVLQLKRCVDDTLHFGTLQNQARAFKPRYHSWEVAAGIFVESVMTW